MLQPSFETAVVHRLALTCARHSHPPCRRSCCHLSVCVFSFPFPPLSSLFVSFSFLFLFDFSFFDACLLCASPSLFPLSSLHFHHTISSSHRHFPHTPFNRHCFCFSYFPYRPTVLILTKAGDQGATFILSSTSPLLYGHLCLVSFARLCSWCCRRSFVVWSFVRRGARLQFGGLVFLLHFDRIVLVSFSTSRVQQKTM